MNSKTLFAVTFSIALAAMSTTVWACRAAGPNKHVGVLLSVDEAANSFTLLDAESHRPITFLAADKLLSTLPHASRRILVDYRIDGAKLRATKIQQ